MKNKLLILSIGILALIAGIGFRTLYAIEPKIDSAQTFLDSTILQDLHNKPQALKQWQGKILIVNFWATWCPPCLKEIPAFIKLQTQYQPQNLQFVGIAIENLNSVKKFALTKQINYPMLIADKTGMTLSKSLGNLAGVVPFSVVISPTGEIIHRQQGEFTEEKIREIIQPWIKPPT